MHWLTQTFSDGGEEREFQVKCFRQSHTILVISCSLFCIALVIVSIMVPELRMMAAAGTG